MPDILQAKKIGYVYRVFVMMARCKTTAPAIDLVNPVVNHARWRSWLRTDKHLVMPS